MSAGSRVSGRFVALVLFALGFAASCGQLLGTVEVAGDAVTTEPLCPAIVTAETATPLCPAPPRPPICEEGVTRCDDRLLQLCTDGGRAWVTWQQCATAALCEASDLSTVAACITPKCALEQMSCEGNLLRLCTEDRTGWQVFDTCKTAAHCDAGKRQCLPAPCEPGDRRCNVGNLEKCLDNQLDWEGLQKCATNEVCEATLVGTLPGMAQGGVEGQTPLPLPPPAVPGASVEGPTVCLAAACVNREVKCDGAQLLACNEGQTDFFPAEPCATPALCQASIEYTGIRGSPRCVRPKCDEGQHNCSETGVLEICNADRTGYVAIEECIGPPFCNSDAADNGLPGCQPAPCESGEQRCNGPQIQTCSTDRTEFLPGQTCETRDLCNDDNRRNAFCRDPVCQRGPLSGTEFQCQGAVLQRCNDQHTGYDTIDTCATPGLCNAGRAFDGCQDPVCEVGQTRCQGDFLQICNAQRTGFDNLERCIPAGTCDGNAGRCGDPCTEGSARCNGQGQLEECRSKLVGREVTARCLSSNLCDANARTCRQPPAGCTGDGVRICVPQGGGVTALQECTAGRSSLVTRDTCTGGEICDANNAEPNRNVCDACAQNSQPTCQGNDLVSCSADGITPGRVNCANGCQTVENAPDRCRNCVPGSATCDGAGLLVCVASGPTNEFRERRPCTTPGACQSTLAACNGGRNGQNCSCAPGVCSPGERDCRGNQPIICNADLTAMVPSGGSCGTRVCFPKPDTRAGTCGCTPGVDVQCVNGLLQTCNRLGVFENDPRFVRGGILCVPSSGGSGESAVSCNGNQIVGPERCDFDCSEESGCAECDPLDFPSTCDGPATHTECVRGQVEERLSCGTTTNACREVVCAGAGNCNPSSPREDGTPCGNGGVCEGGTCAICGDGLINGEEQCDQRRNPTIEIDECPANQLGTITCGNDCRIVRACRTPRCGDGQCDGADTTVNCPQDCGSRCGDGVANGNEECEGPNLRGASGCLPTETGSVSCSPDCALVRNCVPIPPSCGDRVCNGRETTATCPGDCGTLCGDGVANGSEACEGDNLRGAPGCAATETGDVSCSPACTLVRTCQPRQVCTPSAGSCRGNTLFVCNGTGSAEVQTAVCGGGSQCVAATSCDPKAKACIGGGPLTNNPCGQNGTCNNAGACVDNCGNKVCAGPENNANCPQDCAPPAVCAANTARCDGNRVLSCNAQGSAETLTDTCGGGGSACVSPTACQGGRCVAGPSLEGNSCDGGSGTCSGGNCAANCGNDICAGPENNDNCPEDCEAPAVCGDGIVNGDDQCDTDDVQNCDDGRVGQITCVACRIVNTCEGQTTTP